MNTSAGLTRHAGATPYTTLKVLGTPLARTPFLRTPSLSRSGGSKPRPSPGHARKQAGRKETGFTYAQRIAIRKRAGNGDIDAARCEMCGRWLGRHGGQVHHRQNRQSGGSRLRNRPSNGLLACGTPESGCHGKATIGTGQVKREMEAAGFVLNSGQDPAREPILLAGQDGGIRVWLTDDGGYSAEAPGVAA